MRAIVWKSLGQMTVVLDFLELWAWRVVTSHMACLVKSIEDPMSSYKWLLMDCVDWIGCSQPLLLILHLNIMSARIKSFNWKAILNFLESVWTSTNSLLLLPDHLILHPGHEAKSLSKEDALYYSMRKSNTVVDEERCEKKIGRGRYTICGSNVLTTLHEDRWRGP